MMRGMTALKQYRLAVILSGPTSAKAAAVRRRIVKAKFQEIQEEYFDKHNYGTTAHVRPW